MHRYPGDPKPCAWPDMDCYVNGPKAPTYPTSVTAACENLVRKPGGYYRCSLPPGHLTACVPDPAHLAHDDEMARRLLAELDLRSRRAQILADIDAAD